MCSTSVPEATCQEVACASVYVEGREEADRHKWIESEKAGYDLGEEAIREWIRAHWRGFLRARWIEHLWGERNWLDLEQRHFGLLKRMFQQSPWINPILDQFLRGQENLNVLFEALERDWPMAEILEILEVLDINSQRLEFQI